MAQRREKKAPPGKERRPIKKKTSILITESIDWIDYKDVNLLRRFMSERAKVRARRVTGNTQQQQVAVAKAIRVAREMALLPYSVRQVTQRSKGRRDRGERGDRGDRGDREGELRDIPGPIRDEERPAVADEADINEGALDQATVDQIESEFNGDGASSESASIESDLE
jgi:small subunit ribosomal protein S18